MYSVTALTWRADGSRLAVGSLCGAVDIYDACVKRTRYKGRFELTYVSLSQVIVKRLSSGSRIVLKSHFACEISRVNIYQDRCVVGGRVGVVVCFARSCRATPGGARAWGRARVCSPS